MKRFSQMLDRYSHVYPEDKIRGRLNQFQTLLKNTNTVEDLISRKRFEGHVTASGILIWQSQHKVLLMQHDDLPNFYHYYQPGGHFQSSNEGPLAVARRKIEVGVDPSSYRYFPVDTDPEIPIDIDSHFIPQIGDELKHYHHDFRYLFFLNETKPIPDLPKGWRWDDLNELGRQQSLSHLIPKIRNILAEDRPRAFFEQVCAPFTQLGRVSCIAVAHFIPDVVPYLRAVSSSFELIAVIPKPKSINVDTEKRLKTLYNVCPLSRDDIASGTKLLDLISKIQGEFVLLDIGGYFSGAVHNIDASSKGRFLGIVEDTENGYQKYSQAAEKAALPVPIISVARSPLKDNEDFLVGQSIVFSADFVLRNVGSLIQYLQCAVIGYGKIGSSIAHHLLLRGMKPWVFDSNPIKRARAVNQLCNAPLRDYIIRHADVIFSATGNHSLGIHDFRSLKSGCFILSVTSSDDELDLTFLEGEYTADKVAQHVTKYSSFTNYFYLINEGNAVNFIHDAVLGDAIHLVRGEILYAAKALIQKNAAAGLSELPDVDRKPVVQSWLDVFVNHHALSNNGIG